MSLSTHTTRPFSDLVEESLDEAAFLWRRWEGELTSLTRNLDDIWSWTEDRLHGALDGVRIGGASSDVVMHGLLSADIDRVKVCAAILGSSSDAAAIETLTAALSAAEGDRLDAIVHSLELMGSAHALRASAATLTRGGQPFAGALCRLKAFHRATPAAELQTALHSDSPAAQAEAVRAALHLPAPLGDEIVTAALPSDDRGVRLAAVETGISRGVPRAWAAGMSAAGRLDDSAAPYLRLVALLGNADEHEIVYSALRIAALQPHAVWALGHLGTVRAIESLLAGMKYENLARACGEAYCWITGAELERDRLAVQEVAAEVPVFEDDDLDANLIPPPEALWPLPDADAVRHDWAARAPRFAPDVRHVLGQPASVERLMTTVEQGPMLRRHDIAFELRARSRGRYDVETRAFAARQRQMMAAARAAVAAGA
jgi:uncharacterized protein (TIGR02270 family)